MAQYHWEFRKRFHPFAFKDASYNPVQCIKNAIDEIENVYDESITDAAEGAIHLIESIPSSLKSYEGSTDRLKKSIHSAICRLIPIIIEADVSDRIRRKWLNRLWNAGDNDNCSYLKPIANYFGELCVSEHLAISFSDIFLRKLDGSIDSSDWDYRQFNLLNLASLSTLFSAKQYSYILEHIERLKLKEWEYRKWGVESLASDKFIKQAIDYALATEGDRSDKFYIAETCEDILLRSGQKEEAYKRFAFKVNQSGSLEKTSKKIQKKYKFELGRIMLDYCFYDIYDSSFDPTE